MMTSPPGDSNNKANAQFIVLQQTQDEVEQEWSEEDSEPSPIEQTQDEVMNQFIQYQERGAPHDHGCSLLGLTSVDSTVLAWLVVKRARMGGTQEENTTAVAEFAK